MSMSDREFYSMCCELMAHRSPIADFFRAGFNARKYAVFFNMRALLWLPWDRVSDFLKKPRTMSRLDLSNKSRWFNPVPWVNQGEGEHSRDVYIHVVGEYMDHCLDEMWLKPDVKATRKHLEAFEYRGCTDEFFKGVPQAILGCLPGELPVGGVVAYPQEEQQGLFHAWRTYKKLRDPEEPVEHRIACGFSTGLFLHWPERDAGLLLSRHKYVVEPAHVLQWTDVRTAWRLHCHWGGLCDDYLSSALIDVQNVFPQCTQHAYEPKDIQGLQHGACSRACCGFVHSTKRPQGTTEFKLYWSEDQEFLCLPGRYFARKGAPMEVVLPTSYFTRGKFQIDTQTQKNCMGVRLRLLVPSSYEGPLVGGVEVERVRYVDCPYMRLLVEMVGDASS